MGHSSAIGLAALLLLVGAGCDGGGEGAATGGMLADSAPPETEQRVAPLPNEPAPLPKEPVPPDAAAGGMVEDTVARRPAPGAVDSPAPIPAEPKSGAAR